MSVTEIPRAEYVRRLDDIRRLMGESGVDGLLLGNGPNFNYFTGIPMRLHNSRPSLLIIPQSGRPIMIVHTARSEWRHDRPEQAPWDTDVRYYPEMSDIPVSTIRQALSDSGLDRGVRLGVEIGRECYIHMTVASFLKLQEELPEVKFQDASDLTWKLRYIKSPTEIALVREACRLAEEAYDHLFSSRLQGLTESQVANISKKSQLDLGADEIGALIDNARLTWGDGSYDESDMAFRKGDMVWLDTMPAVGGYRADYSRAGVIGKPSQTQLELQESVYEVTMLGVQMIRPGVHVADIASKVNSELRKLPEKFNVVSVTSDLAGRIGHGMGLWTTEWPSIVETDPATLEANMIVTIEPGVANPEGKFHIEQNVLVTETGYELLSTCDWKLRELG